MPPVAPPPSRTHHTTPLPPGAAQNNLSTFLTRTSTQPHLHPDCLLSASGISFSATAGPNGGLALHHLRRIEAGLRGESLVKETREELAHLTGETIAGFEGDVWDSQQEKKEVGAKKPLKSSLKRKKSQERVVDWDDGVGAGHTELPGTSGKGVNAGEDPDWQDKEEYDREQKTIEGEVGERGGAPAVHQGEAAVPPAVIEHADDGSKVGAMKRVKALSEGEKAARKRAKKERNVAMQKEKRKGGVIAEHEEAKLAARAKEADEKAARKAAKKARKGALQGQQTVTVARPRDKSTKPVMNTDQAKGTKRARAVPAEANPLPRKPSKTVRAMSPEPDAHDRVAGKVKHKKRKGDAESGTKGTIRSDRGRGNGL